MASTSTRKVDAPGEDSTRTVTEGAARARISEFREDSRPQRVAIAKHAHRVFGRTLSWGARCGPVRELFRTTSAPVMSRLHMDQRAVLDLLVESGVARSRSDAVAWCVRLVGHHHADWLAELDLALDPVRTARGHGPPQMRAQPAADST